MEAHRLPAQEVLRLLHLLQAEVVFSTSNTRLQASNDICGGLDVQRYFQEPQSGSPSSCLRCVASSQIQMYQRKAAQGPLPEFRTHFA